MVFADAYTFQKHNGGVQSMGLRNALYKVARLMVDVNVGQKGKEVGSKASFAGEAMVGDDYGDACHCPRRCLSTRGAEDTLIHTRA